MEEDIKKIEYFLNQADEYYDGNIDIKDCVITKEVAEAIENLIVRNKELEKYEKYYETEKVIWSRKDYIPKSKLAEILKQRLKKYQDADDGEYKQDYLTRGELELVDRYKECSELLKILCEEDIYKIELDYIPKSKIREKIEELKQNCEGTEDCQTIDIIEALQELLQEGDDK